MSKIAIIDLGSNTFHILIAAVVKGSFEEVYRERQYVFLSENGVDKIDDSAYQRGIRCLEKFSKVLIEHAVDQTKIIGTATLRKASNGPKFVAEIKTKFGLEIETISGRQEASLIAKGVMLSLSEKPDSALIMDIGGGSVEFIITQGASVKWQKSYPIGLSIIYHGYQKSDPINEKDQDAFYRFLTNKLEELKKQVAIYQPSILIGASGSFEVLRDMARDVSADSNHPLYSLSSASFSELSNKLCSLSLDQRLNLEKLPKSRAKYIPIAMLLIHFIVDSFTFDKILISEYALKEGLIAEYI